MLPPIKSEEAAVEAETEDLSIILLSPKKLPKLEHLQHKSDQLHEEAASQFDLFYLRVYIRRSTVIYI